MLSSTCAIALLAVGMPSVCIFDVIVHDEINFRDRLVSTPRDDLRMLRRYGFTLGGRFYEFYSPSCGGEMPATPGAPQ